jgi:hypothetical protein
MEAPEDHPAGETVVPGYRTLPPAARLDETIASVNADPVSDPSGGRNLDQHRASRDD